MPTEPVTTPSESLMIEVLIARVRTGERLWTFDSRHTNTAQKLAEKDLVQWKSASIEKAILVWLTDTGREVYEVDKQWQIPVLKRVQAMYQLSVAAEDRFNHTGDYQDLETWNIARTALEEVLAGEPVVR